MLTDKSPYFVVKQITRSLNDEKTERDFCFSEDFSFIFIVYNKTIATRTLFFYTYTLDFLFT
jgi:hypothetical protein